MNEKYIGLGYFQYSFTIIIIFILAVSPYLPTLNQRLGALLIIGVFFFFFTKCTLAHLDYNEERRALPLGPGRGFSADATGYEGKRTNKIK